MKKWLIALLVISGFVLSGCGGGNDGENSGANSAKKQIIDSGRSLGSSSFDVNFVLGTKFYYRVSSSCTGNGLVYLNYEIYDDMTAKAEYTWNNNVITTHCDVVDVYDQIDVINSEINATKITDRVFYDTTNDIFYVTEYNSYVVSLVEIINNGLTAIGIQNNGDESFLQLDFACKTIEND